MKPLIIAAALLLAPGAAYAAAPVEGTWTTPSQGVVRVAACGAKICGTLESSPNLRTDPSLKDARNKDAAKRSRLLKGVTLLDGFSGGPTQWKGGKIYNPEDGRTYGSELLLSDPNTLKVKGCVGPICQTQTWTRAR